MTVRRTVLGVVALALVAAAIVAGAALGSSTGKQEIGNNNQTPYTESKATSSEPEKKTQWAVIATDGTFVRGSNAVTGTDHSFTGNYIVFFKKNITHCAFVASTGETGDVFSTDGYATTAIANGTTNGVFVRTLDSTGTDADYPFHLIIACNS